VTEGSFFFIAVLTLIKRIDIDSKKKTKKMRGSKEKGMIFSF